MSFANHAGQFSNSYSKSENQKFTEQFAAITAQFATHLRASTPPSDVAVQSLVQQHYEFCLQFWKPTRTAYKALAQSYILPSPYRDSYEAVLPGLAKYHHDAIVVWADANLE